MHMHPGISFKDRVAAVLEINSVQNTRSYLKLYNISKWSERFNECRVLVNRQNFIKGYVYGSPLRSVISTDVLHWLIEYMMLEDC